MMMGVGVGSVGCVAYYTELTSTLGLSMDDVLVEQLRRRDVRTLKQRERQSDNPFKKKRAAKKVASIKEECAKTYKDTLKGKSYGRSFGNIGLVAEPIEDKTTMLLNNMRQGVDFCKHGLSVGGPSIRYVGTDESAEVVEVVESDRRDENATDRIQKDDTSTWTTPTYRVVKGDNNPHQRSMGFDGKIRLFVWYDCNRQILADLISCSCVLGVDTDNVPKDLLDDHWTSLNKGDTIPDKITVTPTGFKVEFISLFARDPHRSDSKTKVTDSSNQTSQEKPYFTTGRKLLKGVLETFVKRGGHLVFLVSTDESVSYYNKIGFENVPSNIITPFPMKGIRKNLLYKKFGAKNPFSGHKKDNPFARATLHLLGHPGVMWDFA